VYEYQPILERKVYASEGKISNYEGKNFAKIKFRPGKKFGTSKDINGNVIGFY
jgi:hypothetical protein